MPTFKIENSVAFVTGTNKKRGIGRAIVQELLKAGAKKVYATARDASKLDDLVAESHGKVVAVELDVTDSQSLAKLEHDFLDVNLLVNNAGVFSGADSLNNSEGAIQEIAVNYYGLLQVTQAFASRFSKVKAKDGKASSAVVNINSIVSFVNFPVGGTYSASKAASHSLTQAQRRDLSESLVVGVYPGPIDTEMADALQFDKAPPEAVGRAVVAALTSGQEDVFPDPMSQQVFQAWKADAKALEVQMAAPQPVATE